MSQTRPGPFCVRFNKYSGFISLGLVIMANQKLLFVANMRSDADQFFESLAQPANLISIKLCAAHWQA